MKVIGLKRAVDVTVIKKLLQKHMPNKDVNYINDKSKAISEGFTVQLDEDWALEQDLKDLGVSVR